MSSAPSGGRARLLQRARAAASVASLLCALWAVFVEPYRLEITRHALHAPRVDRPLRVAHVSDLHTGGLGLRERTLLSALERERPDVIAITGDTVDSGDLERARPVLSAMHAPLGVFAVEGNWEHWRPVRAPGAFFRSVGARLLENEAVKVRDDVWIVGLDDAIAGASDARGALQNVPAGVVTIALFHSPIAFDDVAGRVSLALAGHTHGGQVRVPLLGALWLPEGSGRFVMGWYEKSGSRLYVSRGVGTSLLRVRFACRPELSVIDVTK